MGNQTIAIREAAREIGDAFYFTDEQVKANLKGREQEIYDGIVAILSRHLSAQPQPDLHLAVCNAVGLLNGVVHEQEESRRAHSILRQALVDYANAVQPTTDDRVRLEPTSSQATHDIKASTLAPEG